MRTAQKGLMEPLNIRTHGGSSRSIACRLDDHTFEELAGLKATSGMSTSELVRSFCLAGLDQMKSEEGDHHPEIQRIERKIKIREKSKGVGASKVEALEARIEALTELVENMKSEHGDQ